MKKNQENNESGLSSETILDYQPLLKAICSEIEIGKVLKIMNLKSKLTLKNTVLTIEN
jgi:hypothetical protein